MLARPRATERHELTELGARLNQLAEAVRASGAATERTLGAMHRDLVGERRVLTTRAAFEAVTTSSRDERKLLDAWRAAVTEMRCEPRDARVI